MTKSNFSRPGYSANPNLSKKPAALGIRKRVIGIGKDKWSIALSREHGITIYKTIIFNQKTKIEIDSNQKMKTFNFRENEFLNCFLR